MGELWAGLTDGQAVLLIGAVWLAWRVVDLAVGLITRRTTWERCEHCEQIERLINIAYDQRQHLADIAEGLVDIDKAVR